MFDSQVSGGTEQNLDCEMPECVGGPSDETYVCKNPGDEPLTICESCLDTGWGGVVEVLD